MMYSTLTSVLLMLSVCSPLVSSSPSLSRRGTASDVIQDIYNIDAGVKKLTADVSAYNGGAFPVGVVDSTPVLLDTAAIHTANRKGFADASTAPTFNNPESQQILKAVDDTVLISIPNAIQVLKAKKPQFQQAGLTQGVIASMQLLLNDHDTFSQQVLQRLTLNSADMAQAVQAVATIHNSIQSGITYYQS